jgi:hypothetical protein
MFNSDPLANKAGAILIQKTEPRLEALLAQHGASDPGELPRAVQGQLLQRATLETAAINFPAGNLEMLKHGLQSLLHSAFLAAMDRIRASCKGQGGAFEMTRGVRAAVVLAGFGLPVAPFDLKAMRILAKPSNDMDTVQALFSADKGAYVGYSTCDAPFYLLLTDCVRTLTAVGADPSEPFRSEAAPCAHRRVPSARSWNALQTRNGNFRSSAGRYNFDRCIA